MKKGILFIALLAATVISSYSVSGTYAKYVSSIDSTDEARVAKWSFGLGDNKTNIDLFATSYSYGEDGLKYVKSLGEDNVIAPGTSGKSEVSLVTDIETRFIINFDLEVTDKWVVYYQLNETKTGIDATTITKDSHKGEEGWYAYSPLYYTINYNGDELPGHTIEEIKAALAVYNGNNGVGEGKHSFGPGLTTRPSIPLSIEWKWDANTSVVLKNANATGGDLTLTTTDVNKLDTFMGKNLSTTADKVTFNMTITAEQVAENYAK